MEISEQRQEILNLYNSGKSYATISKLTGVSKATICRIVNRKDHVAKKAAKVKKSSSRVVRSVRQGAELRAYSTIINGNQIEFYEGIKTAIFRMEEIDNTLRTQVKEIMDYFQKVRAIPVSELPSNPELIKALTHVIVNYGNLHSAINLRIKATNELGEWLDRYKEFELISKLNQYYEKTIAAFFAGMDELSQTHYLEVKEAAINHFPDVEKYFSEYEQPESKIS